ncbi:MAG: TonB-dependent receptor [Bacteroidetes bacterium]|nr:TonB-dependent receptor [Bacteroidota bacterium]
MNKYLLLVLSLVISLSAHAQKNKKTESIKVFGACGDCKERIENAVHELGIKKANWDEQTQLLTVSYDSLRFSRKQIEQKVASVGHDTYDFQATDEVYENLPGCCHYDRYQQADTTNKSQDTPMTLESIDPASKHKIAGVVMGKDKNGKHYPLSFAIVHSLGLNETAITDSLGAFILATLMPDQLIINHFGFNTDTVSVQNTEALHILLQESAAQKVSGVVVRGRNESTHISSLSTVNTLNIGSKELKKAACCNLSESFETSPSVDVTYSDAVTGIKQIELLGLSGKYTQLLTENTPEIKGLAGAFGLTFIPGTWIEGIQLTKGAGSVVNGYESIAGQINVEEIKSDRSDRLFVNAYGNEQGRAEGTVNLSHKFDDNWSTALLAHANGVMIKNDHNHDGFLDMPIGRQFNVLSRWEYQGNGIHAQIALKAMNDKRQGGQFDFDPETDRLSSTRYGVGMDVEQYLLTGKLGYTFADKDYKSIGFIYSLGQYNNSSYYGHNNYNGRQTSVYGNLIYQSIISSTTHKFRTGLSFSNENYKENFNLAQYDRVEIVPGAFFEYTLTLDKFSAIAGIREDYHNQFGFFTTPRLHLKYDFTKNTNLRFSTGSGFRVSNIFAENAGVFASSRAYSIQNPSNNYGYGLNPEKAWNYGLNFVHNFTLNQQKGSIGIDLYRTDFQDQVVTDLDASPQQVVFYNLQGKSYSNSIQAELNYQPIKRMDVRLAYRWLDVQSNYAGVMREKPLVARDRAFINIGYETGNSWKFDFTTQWIGKKRLPVTSSNPIAYQLADYSPSYFQMNGQITKQFKKVLDVYVGVENLTNYTQEHPILAAGNPYSPYFDGSMVWGPINGRMVYAGLRYSIK